MTFKAIHAGSIMELGKKHGSPEKKVWRLLLIKAWRMRA